MPDFIHRVSNTLKKWAKAKAFAHSNHILIEIVELLDYWKRSVISFGKALVFFVAGADNSAGKRNWELPAGQEPKAEAQDGASQLFGPAPPQKK